MARHGCLLGHHTCALGHKGCVLVQHDVVLVIMPEFLAHLVSAFGLPCVMYKTHHPATWCSSKAFGYEPRGPWFEPHQGHYFCVYLKNSGKLKFKANFSALWNFSVFRFPFPFRVPVPVPGSCSRSRSGFPFRCDDVQPGRCARAPLPMSRCAHAEEPIGH